MLLVHVFVLRVCDLSYLLYGQLIRILQCLFSLDQFFSRLFSLDQFFSRLTLLSKNVETKMDSIFSAIEKWKVDGFSSNLHRCTTRTSVGAD